MGGVTAEGQVRWPTCTPAAVSITTQILLSYVHTCTNMHAPTRTIASVDTHAHIHKITVKVKTRREGGILYKGTNDINR